MQPRLGQLGAAQVGLDPARLCLAGGEDYELLFTLPPRSRLPASPSSRTRRLGVEATEIGRIDARPGLRGLPALGRGGGWRHF